MSRIRIGDIFKENHNLPEAGNILYNNIKKAISSNTKLVIDMEGVSSLPSIFLNVSVGRIIDEQGKDKLKGYTSFVNITKMQALRLKDYLNRYI